MNTDDRAVVFYPIGVDRPITPDQPLPPLQNAARGAGRDRGAGGRIWRYGLAFHRLHGSPAGAVDVCDPRLGAVVVASHAPEFAKAQVVDVTPPDAGGAGSRED